MNKVKKNYDCVNFSNRFLLVHLHLKGKGKFFISGSKALYQKANLKKLKMFRVFFKILSVDCYIHLKIKRHCVTTCNLILKILKKLERTLTKKYRKNFQTNEENSNHQKESLDNNNQIQRFPLQNWWKIITFLIGLVSILVYVFIDITKTRNLMISDIGESKAKCKHEYENNNCEKLGNIPSLKEFCSHKLQCMIKDHEITYYSLLMKIVVDLLNQMVNTLDNKVLIVCCVLIILKVYKK